MNQGRVHVKGAELSPTDCGTTERIITVAQTRHCDLIAMRSRGVRPLRALLLGSQTQQVLTLAKCPVLVVK